MPCRWSLHSFFDDCQKKKEHTGFTNANKTITKTITFDSFSSPFPFSCLFLYSSFSFSFPFSCPFSFPFPFPFPFVFLSFSFRFLFPFPFLFLSFSIPFPFPFLLLSLSFSFPFPLPFLFFPFPSFTIPFHFSCSRSCEFFDQGVKPALGKTIRAKKNDNVWKNNLKGLGVFTTPRTHTYIYIYV